MSQSMDHDTASPSRSSVDLADSSARKRVGKACDRCRLKKSKCDGSNPCLRCRSDNAICQFGERKKSVDKIYPKGYVELLEQHFDQLVGGLRECYRLLQERQPFPGEPLQVQKDGHPLTHDILKRLSALKPSKDCSIPFDGFEENPGLVLHALNRQLDAESEETTPEEEETAPVATYWPGTTTFQNPWHKPTNIQLRLDPTQLQRKMTPATFLNSVQTRQAVPFQPPMPQRPMLDMHMQMDATPVPQPPSFDPLDMAAMTEPVEMPSQFSMYQWPQTAVRTPGDFNWSNWLQGDAVYMQP